MLIAGARARFGRRSIVTQPKVRQDSLSRFLMFSSRIQESYGRKNDNNNSNNAAGREAFVVSEC